MVVVVVVVVVVEVVSGLVSYLYSSLQGKNASAKLFKAVVLRYILLELLPFMLELLSVEGTVLLLLLLLLLLGLLLLLLFEDWVLLANK